MYQKQIDMRGVYPKVQRQSDLQILLHNGTSSTSTKMSESQPQSSPKRKRRRRRRRPKRPQETPPPPPLPLLLTNDPNICLAIHIAMAHAGLALTIALLYGLTKLLQEYLRPIQWAILCSMPLRELQTALVRFWSHPLNLGLFETLLAIPVAVLRATTGSLFDSHSALLRLLLHRNQPPNETTVGFSKLMQWLVSFGVFVLVYERIGVASVPAFALPCFISYATGYGMPSTPGIAKTLSAISFARRNGRMVHKSSIWSRMSCYTTSLMLNRLQVIVGVGLITFMIVGSVSGFVLFSYKIGLEGKDAVISLKTHMEQTNYAERIGVSRWMVENQVPEFIDNYTTKFYETLSQQIDSLALYYNVTEVVQGVRSFVVKPSQTDKVQEQGRRWLISKKFYAIQLRVVNREWSLMYRDFGSVIREFMSAIAWGDLVDKFKGFVLQSLDVPKRVFASSTMVLVGSANLFFSMLVSIVWGAAELLNFLYQLMVFFWLLYYLITSDSGGVMDHVLGMLPILQSTRVRCAKVLDHAVSSVLLAAAKVILFQGFLTYLLFRFYQIHFLYMSTFLALMSAALPITPTWISSIPAAGQLAMEARYVEAVLLALVHLVLMDYGTAAIQDEIPGQSAYLTGLSILGGMALCPSVLEGAIMGPLLMTVMIALKNLYVEFVLAYTKEASS